MAESESGSSRSSGAGVDKIADAALRRLYEEEQDEIMGRLRLLYDQVRKEEARYAHLERVLER